MSKKLKYIISIIMINLIVIGSAIANNNELNKIIDEIPNNPKFAEQELKKHDSNLAKVYLAYIYATEKVKIDNKDKVVTDIMTSIHKEVIEKNDNYMLRRVDKKYHQPLKIYDNEAIIAVMTGVIPYVPEWLTLENRKFIFFL